MKLLLAGILYALLCIIVWNLPLRDYLAVVLLSAALFVAGAS